MANLYARPVGRLVPRTLALATGREDALTIAGRTDLRFGALEIIERDGPWSGRQLIAARNLRRTGGPAAILPQGLPELLARLAGPRTDIGGLALDRPRIMGIVNVTPDSFSDGGQHASTEAAIAHALQLDAEGADILDIGGESTRPGAAPVALDAEIARVIPVREGLAGRARARLSVDTRNAEVMRRAAAAGAHMLNDVSALAHDPASLRVAAETGLPIVLMHARGEPRTMQRDPHYDSVLFDVYDALAERVAACARVGIPPARLIVDPGIGFGKTVAHNLVLLSGLAMFHGLGAAIMLGASRKSFIGALTQTVDAAERLPGSLAAALMAIEDGVQIVRVHDVAATRQALTIWEAARAGGLG